MLKDKKIVIIGSGTMGKIILAGLLESGHASKSQIFATARTEKTVKLIAEEYGVSTSTDNVETCKDAAIIILAVKPKEIKKVLLTLKNDCIKDGEPLIISIAAGISTGYMEEILETHTPVIRSMPNTPCRVGKGMTVICPGTYVKEEHIEAAKVIFQELGKCLELEEKHMDAVTGLSASGPAFIYLIAEALSDGGVMVGLPRKVAHDLVVSTILGSAYMMEKTEIHPASLKDDVTTPAGCTISGILTLEDGKIRSVLARAVQIAAIRAGELGT